MKDKLTKSHENDTTEDETKISKSNVADNSGEISPSQTESKNSNSIQQLNVFNNFLLFNQKPEAVLSFIEQNNPGFVKRATQKIEEYEELFHEKRFKFSDLQAYASLSIRYIGVLVSCAWISYVIWQDNVGFWNTLLILLFFAASQSGHSTIKKMFVDLMKQIIKKI